MFSLLLTTAITDGHYLMAMPWRRRRTISLEGARPLPHHPDNQTGDPVLSADCVPQFAQIFATHLQQTATQRENIPPPL